MLGRYWKRFGMIGGAMALVAIGATPASAATSSCPIGTPTYFAGGTVYLGQEPGTDIWSSPVTLYAYCGAVAPATALTGVRVTAITAMSNGLIPHLEATADGTVPTAADELSPSFPGTSLPIPTNLVTDSNGAVTFTLRATSPVQADLAGPGGVPQLIGLQLDFGAGSADSGSNGANDPSYQVLGGGSIFAATPELDSLMLFGSGAMALASYGWLRVRSRNRK